MPTSTEVTAGCDATHATASVTGATPSSAASAQNRSAISKFAGAL